ncbi:hypothetical protein SRHO_G00012850 [Serrasalmus rhombeus]
MGSPSADHSNPPSLGRMGANYGKLEKCRSATHMWGLPASFPAVRVRWRQPKPHLLYSGAAPGATGLVSVDHLLEIASRPLQHLR